MNAISSQASTTRRSAGIPSMMTGILSANASNPSFEHVMEKLMSIASKEARVSETDGSNLPQVHAYNCLKDIFKNSMLTAMGNKSEKYLPRCLELAASGLRSEVWAIRNCGLIFLRSLIDCLFGSQESKSMIEAGWDGRANRIAYHRYPNLPPVLRNLLKSGHQMLSQTGATVSAAESVFPALDIIRRAGPPELLRDEIQVDVAVYLSSPVWHVRELAARTLCSCLLHERWLQTIKDVLQDALLSQAINHQNHVHGVLLTLRFVIERLHEVAADRLMADLPELTLFLSQISIDAGFPCCPDIAAAYFEVVNHIWAFEKANSKPLSPFKVTMPANTGSALLRNQKAIHDVYMASSENNSVERLRALLLDQKVGIDGLVTGLETLPKLWRPSSTSEQTLIQLCGFYIDICLKTGLVEAQIVAVRNLGGLMEQLLHQGKVDTLPANELVELWTALPSRPMSPALSNAVISASGCIMAALRNSQGAPPVDLQNWGRMMADAGMEDKTLDTRFAAVRSLRSFFAVAGVSGTSEEHLPALLALYDALNDDDDEVRDVGATAVNGITGEALVPLEAANCLLRWLARHFGNSSSFKAEVASRMVGHYGIKTLKTSAWEPAEHELAKAMEFDDSLFVVEERNLFIDEVREAKRWVDVFESLQWDGGDETLARLDSWIQGGIVQVGELVEREDGPLGWASNPQAFALCTLLVRGSVAMAKKQGATPELREATASTREALSRPLIESGAEDAHRILRLELADLALQQLDPLQSDVPLGLDPVELQRQVRLLLALNRLPAPRLGLALLLLALLLELLHLAPVLGLLLGKLLVVLLADLGHRGGVLFLLAVALRLKALLHLGVVFVESSTPLDELLQLPLRGLLGL
ncbi:hypothetical protein TOPH_00464 [Tolypocladium ophioglossoides CBS 100239]|uniref:Uncharacterized protein n=1 Tax=Tolypocladium ophioglossoides (strain CBS 100239) TaxID=1163406 RepID=A0A0L0NMV7_TOLOC|nr:hypothetical protein TOPH_00464 [Tolypocladium ophioglossoides CBS 100239]